MASDYVAISIENRARYGWDIGRFGPPLLAERYADRTHFIFELLQNAEDARSRRPHDWRGPRSIAFNLSEDSLRVSHYGELFSEPDVRGVCGIAESTKGLTEIGRFGIGFKSVYAFTERPEIHSGPEDFAIETLVRPIATDVTDRDPDETVILIPLREGSDHAVIAAGLERLGARALLFLRHIDEISWTVGKEAKGTYLRGTAEELDVGVRRVVVVGEQDGLPDTEEEWLILSRPVFHAGERAGHVELAFLLLPGVGPGQKLVRAVHTAPLVVYFPTALETHLGFLVQGPFRTTPSRDNIPADDEWNRHCVKETASLLGDALLWLRDHELLDVGALQCLPLDSWRFDSDSMLRPLFDVTRTALLSLPLLPAFPEGYVAGDEAVLARGEGLRELVSREQLGGLLADGKRRAWLSPEITQDKTPDLFDFLKRALDVPEITPERLIPRLEKTFLERQASAWVMQLYVVLLEQRALRRQLRVRPLVRLQDGTHVPAFSGDTPQAYLPTVMPTDFPMVDNSVCEDDRALQFLRELGLTEPNIVDDVVRNTVPKYQDSRRIDAAIYERDIDRILSAFETDSKQQRDKLIGALRASSFVMSTDASGMVNMSRPGDVYLATERLRALFADVPGVTLVDDSYACLRGEKARELLEACGATRHLRPVADASLDRQERRELREGTGHPETSGQNDQVTDWALKGLAELLGSFPALGIDQRLLKARLLWDELSHLEERRGASVFSGEYVWTHYGRYRTAFDAEFVRTLNATDWIPDADGILRRPQLALFESLEWEPNPFLQSKIRFKPPVIDELAREAGFEPGMLDLLKHLGLTNEAGLRARLGLERQAGSAEPTGPSGADGEPPDDTETLPASSAVDSTRETERATSNAAGSNSGVTREPGSTAVSSAEGPSGLTHSPSPRTPGSSGGRSFISYVAVQAREEPDPDGLDAPARIALEEEAIRLILHSEPDWRRTPTNNPGFDLIESSSNGRPTRWCEVKAMTGSLLDRPVGMTRMQFESAQNHGNAYLLYVVEHAGTDRARIVRIQDPAGQARTFTFDRGWLGVAEPVSSVPSKQEPVVNDG